MEAVDLLVNNAGLASGLSTIQEGDFADGTMLDTNERPAERFPLHRAQ